MKRKHIFWIGLVAVLIAVATVYGAMTNSADQITNYSNYITSQNRYLNPLYKFANEVEGILEGATAVPAMMRTVQTAYTGSAVLLSSQTGTVIVSDGNDTTAGNVIFSLPTAAAGLVYTIVDANVTANDDVYVKAAAGDTINGGTAGQYVACKTDLGGQSITLQALDDTRWVTTAYAGTWVADDSPD